MAAAVLLCACGSSSVDDSADDVAVTASASAAVSSAAASQAWAGTDAAPSSAGAAPNSKALTAEVSASVAAAATAAGSVPADPDVPGDDGGRRCKNNEQYADERPTGMRADAEAAWLAVEAVGASTGVKMCLADGKRSRAQQQQTYDEYLAQYGPQMAAQYVLPPVKSAHVLGTAVDVQPYAAYTWLESTRGTLGWCRMYDNEVWHFEYDEGYVTGGCPARVPHPTP